MKTVFSLFLFLLVLKVSFSQDDIKVKLFIDMPLIDIEKLDSNQEKRLFDKTVQIANRVTAVDVGYSKFLIYPDFDIIDMQVSETGMQNIYVANCEYSLYVARRDYVREKGQGPLDAIYSSHVVIVQGSGYTKQAAINNAINNIPTNDKSIKDFIVSSKRVIVDYFNDHCGEVLREARQAYRLGQYGRSISLYFSIPESAKECYNKADTLSVAVYRDFRVEKCKKDLMNIRANIAAVSNNIEGNSTNRYQKVLNMIEEISPIKDCYVQAKLMVEKLETKFGEQEKIRWEGIQQKAKANIEIQKARYKSEAEASRAAAAAAANYRPPNSPANVYINTGK